MYMYVVCLRFIYFNVGVEEKIVGVLFALNVITRWNLRTLATFIFGLRGKEKTFFTSNFPFFTAMKRRIMTPDRQNDFQVRTRTT